ncbi:uncharacterized protein LOC135139351 [Zophobas morio]|uniref:uncharacterized protein LOC135139351 n=1 Tax=Zophobas morio TaxID=2755281 RepID=UPI003082C602
MAQLKNIMASLEDKILWPKNSQQRKLIEPGVNFWKFTYRGFYFPVIFNLLMWAVYPIMDGSAHESKLPFSAWYPFSTKNSPSYEITYFYQIIGISVLAITNLNMDTFVAALMMYVGSQCEILCDSLKNCGRSGTKNYNTNLIECVNHHRKIIR